ncbi:MAG: MgtC/SapB family protein [Gammaproteobacteria bacterium]|jgi:putative Mg2+ transporter-C (MgtC) family protein
MEAIIDQAVNLNIVSPGEALLRIILSVLLASVLGLERDFKNKPIDFRAFSIIALASCVLAIMSQEIYADYASAEHVVSIDLAKIVAGVLTGIGFLGAGAIIKNDKGIVIGTATGASIWASGSIGLTIGFGFYALAFVTFLMLAIILLAGGALMKLVYDKDDHRDSKNH